MYRAFLKRVIHISAIFLLVNGFLNFAGGHSAYALGSNDSLYRFDTTFFGQTFNYSAGQSAGDNHLLWPRSLAVDALGNFYTAELYSNRVHKISSSGTNVSVWGSPGTGNGQFSSPSGLAIDSANNVYVTDINGHRIQKFSSTGTYLASFNSWGAGLFDNLSAPYAVTIDASGYIYIANTGRNNIVKLNPDLTYNTSWASPNSPAAIHIDGSGNLYVGEQYGNTVRIYNTGGVLQNSFTVSENGISDIATDGSGNIYVGTSSNKIIKLGSDFAEIYRWQIYGVPYGLLVDNSGVTYVTGSDKILKSRIASTNNNLSALTVAGQTLSPAFDQNTTEYRVDVSSDVTSVDITAVKADGAAIIKVNNATVGSGETKTYRLGLGENVIDYEISADSGDKKTYQITVNVVAPPGTLIIRPIEDSCIDNLGNYYEDGYYYIYGDNLGWGKAAIKFDISQLAGKTVTGARFYTKSEFAASGTSEPLGYDLLGSEDDSWSDGVSFPATEDVTILANVPDVGNGEENYWQIFDGSQLKDFIVNRFQSSSQYCTLILKPNPAYPDGYAHMLSDETASSADSPFLLIYYTDTPVDSAPFATDVSILGTAKAGQMLTGHYIYDDAENDPEGESTYKWYRSDDADGTNKAVIDDAEENTYTLATSDIHKYISFEVTPITDSGISPGIAVESPGLGPVAKAAQTAITYHDVSKIYGDGDFNHTASGGSGTGAFSYTSSDPTVATIDSATGHVVILKTGAATLTASKAGDAVYDAASQTCALTINKVLLTATVQDYSKTYGEENPDFIVEVTGFVKDETAATAAGYNAPTASSGATAATDFGTAAITISSGTATNYAFNTTDTGSLTINKKLLTATATANDKIYDGHTTGTGTISLDGKVGADDVTASGAFAFDDAHVAADKTVHVTDISLGGIDSGNYTVNESTTGLASITVKVITPSAEADDKIYDGNTEATGRIIFTEAVENDDLSATGIFAFLDAVVGSDKTVNVTGITLGGAQADNYSLSATTALAVADITKQAQSITVSVLPTVTTYSFGEELSPAGGVVTILYNDNSTSTTSLTSEMCLVADNPAIGERIVTVTYLTQTATFQVTYNKGSQAPPAAPECSVTDDGITVTAPVGDGYAYSIDGGAHWQTDVTFSDLTHDEEYTIITRLMETATHNPSNASEGTLLTFIDSNPPTITADQVIRTSQTDATVKFTSSEAGEYYYEVVEEGAPEPDIAVSEAGIACTLSQTTVYPALTPGAKDIYIVVKDAVGNESNALKINIPAYVLTDRDMAVIDLDSLTWEMISGENASPNSVTENLELTVTGAVYGSNISWTSSNTTAVSIDGIVARPSYAQGNATVIMTASIYNDLAAESKAFEIRVLKEPAATNADLSGLTAGNLTLIPAFSSDETSYHGNVGHGTSSITLTPSTADGTATVTVNGSPLVQGSSTVSLSNGNNTIVIEVMAQDGTTDKRYTIIVYRANGGSNGSPAPQTDTLESEENGVQIIVNGNAETAATSQTTLADNKTVTTITLDDEKIEEKLQDEGQNAVVTIPAQNDADIVIGELNGQTVKNMETKDAVLEIKTENTTYILPASQINIDNVSAQFGEQVELKDITVSVRVAEPLADTVKIIEDIANKNNYQLVVTPVEFEITCANGDKTVAVSRFNGYVQRTMAIPEGIDPSKITTGIILNGDGTFSHVPTTIVVINGKYYAKINSLTNSAYSVIWNEKKFADSAGHWAKEDIHDMASRLIINGVNANHFEPERDITRAEFAAIIVKALGLMRPGTGKNAFADIDENAWYRDAVNIACEYQLISGYEDHTFRPNRKITREEEMVMLYRAMKITKLNTEISEPEMARLIGDYDDGREISLWAKDAAAACLQNGIVSGYKKNLMPRANITRAETAATVRRMLRNSMLIN